MGITRTTKFNNTLQNNVVFHTQEVTTCDMCEVSFVVSSITMNKMWCLLWHYAYITLKL
jgi:hypothetical protein